jgi:Mg/Co/Ni transporter MgtE
METKDTTHERVRARDAAMRLLNRLTTGAAVSAVIGVGLFGAVSAYTIPGTKTSSTASTSTTSTSSSTSTSTASGLQSSTTPVTSSSGSGVAVSGGS